MPTGYVDGRFETSGFPYNEGTVGSYSSKQVYFPALSFQPTLAPSMLMRDDELRNTDQSLTGLPEAYSPSWSMETRAYPDSLGYLLTMALGTPVTAAGGTDLFGSAIPAIAAGTAYKHRWSAPFGPVSSAYPYTSTFRVAYKDQSTFYALRGAGAQTLSISSPESGGCRISVSGPALFMSRTADPSLSPTYEALTIAPFMRSGLTLPAWLSSTGTTEDFSVTITNPQEAYRSLGYASRYPDTLEKANAGPVTVTGSIPKRQLDPDDYDALLNATTFAGTARYASTQEIVSGGTATYKLHIAFDALQYTDGGPNALQNVRRIGQDLSFRAGYDGAGTAVIFELVNATASYS